MISMARLLAIVAALRNFSRNQKYTDAAPQGRSEILHVDGELLQWPRSI
jgi:hypothetical protein